MDTSQQQRRRMSPKSQVCTLTILLPYCLIMILYFHPI